MAILYEYYNEVNVQSPMALKTYLHQIWQEQFSAFTQDLLAESEEEESVFNQKKYQPFLNFDGTTIRARNWVGFIHLGDLQLELYPKVFRGQPASPILMLRHLFFWFDYCRKWKFPFTRSNLDHLENARLPELLIYLMGAKMLEIVSSMPISLYHPVEEPLLTPRGNISFERYLSAGFVNGNQHLIDCDHDPFVFDNRLNQIIKYTTRLLLNKTVVPENRRILEELIFILDEIEDRPCHYTELDTIIVNPIFGEYNEVKNICRTVLQQLLYSNQHYDLSQWCMLFPMEYIFEDFIAGFLEAKFSAIWKVEYQKSDLNLSSDPEAFRMQHDILLTLRDDPAQKILIDTKYKLRERDFKSDKKKGIAQTDMYQMVTYAMKRGVERVLLLYPNVEEQLKPPDRFVVQSGFSGEHSILIIAAEVPFWSTDVPGNLALHLEEILHKILM